MQRGDMEFKKKSPALKQGFVTGIETIFEPYRARTSTDLDDSGNQFSGSG